MDTATLNSIISGMAALFGAGIGGSVTLFSASKQHKRQVLRDRDNVIRDRQQKAVVKCEQLCVAIASGQIDYQRRKYASDGQEQGVARSGQFKTLSELTAESLYLPDDLRQRIELLGDIVYNADEISGVAGPTGGTHYHSLYTICWHVEKEVRALVAAYLQDRALPTQNRIIDEYKDALDDLRKEWGSFYEDDHDPRAEQAQESFYALHPQYRPS